MLLYLLAACAPQPQIAVEPASVRAFGHAEVTLDLSETDIDPERVARVEIGGVDAIDLRPQGQTLTVYVVGSDQTGPVDVVVHADDTWTFEDALTYEPGFTLDGPLVAIGGSVTHGTQNAIIGREQTTNGTAAWIARALGVYFPSPLLVDDLFPDMLATDVAPPPDCTLPDSPSHAANAAIEALGAVFDEELGQANFALGRLNPDHVSYNLAVPGSAVGDTLRGPPTDEFAEQSLWHLVHDPHGDIYQPVPYSQIDLLEQIGPAVVVSADLVANDAIDGVLAQPGLDPEVMRTPEMVEPDLRELIDRVTGTGAMMFVGDIPDLTHLPLTTDSVAVMRDEGATEDEIDELLAELRAKTDALNAMLYDLADEYDGVHVVPFADEVELARIEGLAAGDAVLTTRRFDGLVSLDGLHFSHAGYAATANVFIRTMNDVLGLRAEEVDLAPIVEVDPFSPANLAAQGLTAEDCPSI